MKKLCASTFRVLSMSLRRLAGWLGALSYFFGYIRFKYFEFVPEQSDIFIVSYPRSGTTWLQMIVYQLMTDDAAITFSHVSEVMPWLEQRIWTNAFGAISCRTGPRRVFKSHLPYGPGFLTIPKGPCKYIYIARDGRDVAMSFYRFYESHLRFQGSFDEFFHLFMRGKVQFGSWFKHVAGWRAAREQPNVLFLSYEEMSKDLLGAIGRIALFCGFEVTHDELERVASRSTFEFMKHHEAKFDHLTELQLRLGIRPGQFLRRGELGHGENALNEAQAAAFENAFAKWFEQGRSSVTGSGPTGKAATF
jgi:hypothetical protein